MYNDRILQRIERYRNFFRNKVSDQIMVCISPYTFPKAMDGFTAWGKKLNEWVFPQDIDDLIEGEIEQMDHFLEVTDSLDDDYVPIIAPFLGVGFLGAMMTNQEVVFTDDTSWSHETLDWIAIDKLHYDLDNPHLQLMRKLYQTLVDKQNERFTIGTLSHFAPIDMANAIRGNNLFYDYYDHPGELKAMLDKIADYTINCEEGLKEITGYVENGFTTASMWMPGKGPFMSEDAGDLGSSQLYREFAMPATQRVLNHFGGGFIHHHAKGWQIHKDITELQNLTAVEFSWDPNCPRPVDHMDELYPLHTVKLPLQIRCKPEDIYKYIDVLRKFRLIIMLNVDTVEEGQEALNFLKDRGLRS